MRGLVLLPLFVIFLLVITTQTFILRALLVPQLEAALNVEVTTSRVHVASDGSIVMYDVRVQVPGVDGDPGEFLRIRRLRAWVDWPSLVRRGGGGRPSILRLRPVGTVARFSQDVNDWTLNVESLRLSRSNVGGGALPRIDPTWVLVDLGEHDGSRYTPLRLLKLNAAISPDSTGYTVILDEGGQRARDANGESMSLTARIDASGINATLSGMRLDAWRAEAMPTPIRPFFASLALSGGVSDVSFAYGQAGMEAILHLQGVAMNIPEVSRHNDPTGAPLRMSDVHGSIRLRAPPHDAVVADFAGLLEDLPYEVRLRWHGLSLNSGFDVEFSSRGFALEGNPRLLPFAPALARYRFESFSRPTATVDAFVTVTREAPVNGVASEVRQIGRINFHDCSASYQRFPYRFHNMTGQIEFDDDEVRILSITGTSSRGATLNVHGRVGPLTEAAEVDLWIDIDGVPIDEELESGLGSERAEIVSELFNQPALAALIESGLIRDARGTAETRDQPAQPGSAPPFALGGKVNLRLHLHRRMGETPHWEQQIRVIMPEVGLLARRFPYPIVGRDAILDIGDREATLSGGQWRTLNGEDVDISARVGVYDDANEPDFNPHIEIKARDIVISDLLIHALPGERAPTHDGKEGSTVREIVRSLGPTGVGSAVASIVRRDGIKGDELGFDVQIAIANATIAPPRPTSTPTTASAANRVREAAGTPDHAAAFVLRNVRGDIVVNEKYARIDLLGTQDLAAPATTDAGSDSRQQPLPPTAPGGQIRVTADATFNHDRLTYSCEVAGSRVHLDIRAEDVVRAFSPAFAEQVTTARRDLSPGGSVDGVLKIWSESDGTRATVEIASARELSFNILGGRMEIRESSGAMTLSLGGEGADDRVGAGETATFEAVRATMMFDGEPAGEMSLHGTISLSALREGHSATLPPTNLAMRMTGARFESSLPTRIVERYAPEDLGEWWREARPVGMFEHEMNVSPPADGDGPLRVLTTIRPLTIEFTHEDERVRIVEAFGTIQTRPEGGEFNFDLIRGQGWSARTSGHWTQFAEGGVSIRASLAADAAEMPTDFIALLPRALRESLDGLAFESTGILSLDDVHVAYSTYADGEWSTAARGSIDATAFSLRAGLEFTQATASAVFTFTREIGEPQGKFELDVFAPEAMAQGVSLTGLHAAIISTGTQGEIIVPQITAASHGGRMSGVVHVRLLEGSGESERKEYFVETTLADVAFGPLVNDLRAAMEQTGSRGRTPQGQLSGRITLSGIIGDEAARRGTAVLVVGGGEVVTMPLALPLIEASNLALPLGAVLDTARADLFIEGDMVSFEELSLVSPAVWIWGFGRMSLSTKELDLRFKSRAANRFPILSDLIEGIRNELVSVRVRGTLGQQQVMLEQFPGPIRMVGRMFGQRGSQRQRRLDEMEARFDRGRWGAAPNMFTDDTIAARRAATQEYESK